MARGDDVIPYRPPGNGLPAYHEADEGWSGRTVRLRSGGRAELEDYGQVRIKIVTPFWASPEEEFAFNVAAEKLTREPDEGPVTFIRRIAERATKKLQAGPQGMPAGMTYQQRDERLQTLRGQMDEEPERWWDK